MALFGLGIMPYITSSIIIQLLSTVIPKLEEWRDQGAVGQKKLTQTTRYLTIGLALLQSAGLVYVFHNGGGGAARHHATSTSSPTSRCGRAGFICLTLTAGTAFVMWLGELITQRGIGNGMSIIIFANVVAGIPAGGTAVLTQGGSAQVRRHRGPDPGAPGRGGLHGAGPAAHPRHLRQTGGGAAPVRGVVDLHPAQGQPVRCHPDHLRQLAALHPGAAGQHHPLDRRSAPS